MAYLSNSHRKFAAAAITASLVATAVVPAYAAPYSDVSNRYDEAINYLTENQIAQGITATSFGTAQPIKRADVAVMVAKALKLDVNAPADSGFTDVPKRAKNYVDALKAAGIVNGKTATTFASDQEITRGEAAIMLAKAFNLKGEKTKMTFTDVSSRYADSVAALVATEITSGKTKTSFGTTQAITRGEFAIFLHKLSKLENAAPSSAIVKNELELQAALKNTDIQHILLAESIVLSKDLIIKRNVKLDLNGQVLTGNISYENNANSDFFLTSSIKSGKLAGNLTVNVPNADFTVGENVEITGLTTIVNVKASTFYNRGILHSVVIRDIDGASFANVENGIVLDELALDTTGKVALIGSINLVTVNQAARVNVGEQSSVKKMIFKANGATIDNFKGKIDILEALQGIIVKDSFGKLVEMNTENPGSPGIITTAYVKNLEELEAALAAERIKTINLTQNIEGLTEQIKINRTVNLNGRGFKLQFTNRLNTAQTGERSGIVILADQAKVFDLNVKMADVNGWEGTYALQVYGAKDVLLHNFTGTGADAALLVNGSTVELTGTTTVEGNEFGGIEVSKGSDATLFNSELKVSGSIINTQETTGTPTIWAVEGKGSVSGNAPAHSSSLIKPGQVQYYVSKAPVDAFHKSFIEAASLPFYQLVDLDLPLDKLESPIKEVFKDWETELELLEEEKVSESNQMLIQGIEKNAASYISDRIIRFTRLIAAEDYTVKSFEKLTAAKEIAVPATFGEAIEKAAKVNEAVAQLVFAAQADLDLAVAKADALKEADYAAASYQRVKEAAGLAQPHSNQEAIAKVEAVSLALSALVFESQKTLDEAINSATALAKKDYTLASFAEVEEALNLPLPTSNQLAKEKAEAIQTAMAGLIFKNQQDLDAALRKAETYVAVDFTAASFNELELAIVLKKPQSNQEVLNKIAVIHQAISELVFADQGKLNEIALEAGALVEADYTADSYEKVSGALMIPAPTSNQEVKAKANQIASAIAQLIFADQDKLNQIELKAASLIEADYTVESYEKVSDALAISKPSSNEEVKAKANQIASAIAQLIFADQDKLNRLELKAASLTAADYTDGSYKKVSDALAISKPSSNEEVKAKADQIASAISKLVFADQDSLDAAIERAQTYKTGDYTSMSYGELTAALNLPVPTSNAAVKQQKNAIDSAISQLVFASQAALDTAIATASNYLGADFTSSTYSNLEEALELPKPTTEAQTKAKADAINTAITGLVFAGQAALEAAMLDAKLYVEADYTEESYQQLASALTIQQLQSNNEVKAKTAMIRQAIDQLVFADQAKLDMAKNRAADIEEAHYSASSVNVLKAALRLAETTNAEVNSKAEAVANALDSLKYSITGFTAIDTIKAGSTNTAPAAYESLLPQKIQVVLASGKTRELTVAEWTDVDGYNHQAAGSYTFAAKWDDQTDIDFAGQAFSVEVAVEELPLFVNSKSISNFDYSTSQATSASLSSKPVTVGDFTGNPKSFVIVAGEHRIPVNIYWKLSTDFTRGQSMGGVVDSAIQDYFYAKLGVNGLMNRTVNSYGFNDTFSINSYLSGSASTIRLEGPDWNYFFEQNYSAGKDLDASKNRSFTVSVGEKTATINLTTKFAAISNMVTTINSQLSKAKVPATAVVIDSSHFKIVSSVLGQEVLIGGTHKGEFFLEEMVD
ncbi:S-layer homology domain-containing protein [Planococcus ruber]|uniref:S-layer homology domain-containing protein n=1 Tax=Planococcus ruber TaxID=2027871 RepID=UPI001FED56C8|nr:S-layer homology domain-containing protein [Planococcus ruber]MCJ1908244.1 S-layer homology domain-containing protein [Planococcus ruber]